MSTYFLSIAEANRELEKIYEQLQKAENEIQELKFDNRQLEEQIELLENDIFEYDEVLEGLAVKLDITLVPNATKWSLLLDIERAIEKVNGKG